MPDSVTTLDVVLFGALVAIALALIGWLFAVFLRNDR